MILTYYRVFESEKYKLRAFPHYCCLLENTQFSPTLTQKPYKKSDEILKLIHGAPCTAAAAAPEPKEDNNNLAAFPKKTVGGTDEDAAAAAMDLFRKTKSLFPGVAPMQPPVAPPAPPPPGQHLPDVVSSPPMFPAGGPGGPVSPLRSPLGPPPPNATMAAAIARLPFLADQVTRSLH